MAFLQHSTPVWKKDYCNEHDLGMNRTMKMNSGNTVSSLNGNEIRTEMDMRNRTNAQTVSCNQGDDLVLKELISVIVKQVCCKSNGTLQSVLDYDPFCTMDVSYFQSQAWRDYSHVRFRHFKQSQSNQVTQTEATGYKTLDYMAVKGYPVDKQFLTDLSQGKFAYLELLMGKLSNLHDKLMKSHHQKFNFPEIVSQHTSWKKEIVPYSLEFYTLKNEGMHNGRISLSVMEQRAENLLRILGFLLGKFSKLVKTERSMRHKIIGAIWSKLKVIFCPLNAYMPAHVISSVYFCSEIHEFQCNRYKNLESENIALKQNLDRAKSQLNRAHLTNAAQETEIKQLKQNKSVLNALLVGKNRKIEMLQQKVKTYSEIPSLVQSCLQNNTSLVMHSNTIHISGMHNNLQPSVLSDASASSYSEDDCSDMSESECDALDEMNDENESEYGSDDVESESEFDDENYESELESDDCYFRSSSDGFTSNHDYSSNEENSHRYAHGTGSVSKLQNRKSRQKKKVKVRKKSLSKVNSAQSGNMCDTKFFNGEPGKNLSHDLNLPHSVKKKPLGDFGDGRERDKQ